MMMNHAPGMKTTMSKIPDYRIRDVEPSVRKSMRLYALQHDMSVAEALKALVELAQEYIALNQAAEAEEEEAEQILKDYISNEIKRSEQEK